LRIGVPHAVYERGSVDADRGGSVEASRPTPLYSPVLVEAGVTPYLVKNVPASVPVTASHAL
jgi:alanine dehydrogenase